MTKQWLDFWDAGGFAKVENLDLFIKAALSTGANENGGPGSVLVAIVLFAIMHQAYVLWTTCQPAAPDGSPLRAVWVWNDKHNESLPFNAVAAEVVANPKQFAAWAKGTGVNRAWVDFAASGANNDVLTDFCSVMKDHCIVTEDLFSPNPNAFLVHAAALRNKKDSPLSLQLAARLNVLSAIPLSVRPVGLQMDNEPYQPGAGLMDSTTHIVEPEKWTMYLQFLQDMKSAVLQKGFNFTLVVPRWYIGTSAEQDANTASIVGKYATAKVKDQQLADALFELGLDLVVEDYSKWYADVEAFAKAWCLRAAKFGREAWIGLETLPLSDVGYSTKMAELNTDLNKLAKLVGNKPGFGGFGIHDAQSYLLKA